MKNLALFGGSGGLGSQLKSYLVDYNVYSVSSKDVNVTDYKQVFNFFNQNKIDVVINLSGYNYDSFIHKYTESNISEAEKQIKININGTLNILACCLPNMRAQNYGRIILTSSILATTPVISTGVYSACKGFIDTITKTICLENSNKNITCNSLQLGYFDGGLTYKIPEEFRNKLITGIPSKRLGTIEELYNTINYLISTEYINGQNIRVSGGIL